MSSLHPVSTRCTLELMENRFQKRYREDGTEYFGIRPLPDTKSAPFTRMLLKYAYMLWPVLAKEDFDVCQTFIQTVGLMAQEYNSGEDGSFGYLVPCWVVFCRGFLDQLDKEAPYERPTQPRLYKYLLSQKDKKDTVVDVLLNEFNTNVSGSKTNDASLVESLTAATKRLNLNDGKVSDSKQGRSFPLVNHKPDARGATASFPSESTQEHNMSDSTMIASEDLQNLKTKDTSSTSDATVSWKSKMTNSELSFDNWKKPHSQYVSRGSKDYSLDYHPTRPQKQANTAHSPHYRNSSPATTEHIEHTFPITNEKSDQKPLSIAAARRTAVRDRTRGRSKRVWTTPAINGSHWISEPSDDEETDTSNGGYDLKYANQIRSSPRYGRATQVDIRGARVLRVVNPTLPKDDEIDCDDREASNKTDVVDVGGESGFEKVGDIADEEWDVVDEPEIEYFMVEEEDVKKDTKDETTVPGPKCRCGQHHL